jgi:hypothetical protein
MPQHPQNNLSVKQAAEAAAITGFVIRGHQGFVHTP